MLFLRSLRGATLALDVPAAGWTAADLHALVRDVDGVAAADQCLTLDGRPLLLSRNAGAGVVVAACSQQDHSLRVALRLRGGKGGFGQNLRTQQARMGAKGVTDDGACRDLSGRRLRDVRAEAELAAWLAQDNKASAREVNEQMRLARAGGRAQQPCKWGAGCKYRATCRASHPADEAQLAAQAARAERVDLSRRLGSDTGAHELGAAASAKAADVRAAVQTGLARVEAAQAARAAGAAAGDSKPDAAAAVAAVGAAAAAVAAAVVAAKPVVAATAAAATTTTSTAAAPALDLGLEFSDSESEDDAK